MSTEITKYQPTDLDEIERERKELEKDKEERKARQGRLELQVGKNVIRILPAVAGQKSPFFKMWVHYVKNPATPDKGGRPILCPTKNRNKPCLICKTVSEMRRTGNEIDKKAANSMSATRRIYANVVDTSNPDRGVQVAEFGITIYEELLSLMQKPDPVKAPDAVGDITHPDVGFNIVIEKTVGDPNNLKETTRYKVRAARQPSALANKKWLGELRDLHKVHEELTDEKITALLEGRKDDPSFPPDDDAPAFPPDDDAPASADPDYEPPR